MMQTNTENQNIYLKVAGNFYITCDPHNWIVVEEKTIQKGDNKGEIYKKPVGYFRRFDEAVARVLCARIKQGEAKTLEEFQGLVCTALRDVKQHVNEMLPESMRHDRF